MSRRYYNGQKPSLDNIRRPDLAGITSFLFIEFPDGLFFDENGIPDPNHDHDSKDTDPDDVRLVDPVQYPLMSPSEVMEQKLMVYDKKVRRENLASYGIDSGYEYESESESTSSDSDELTDESMYSVDSDEEEDEGDIDNMTDEFSEMIEEHTDIEDYESQSDYCDDIVIP